LMDISQSALFLSYSRQQERQADERAVQTLKILHDDINDATELFQWLVRQESLEMPEFLSSHPNPLERIESIQAAIESSE